jgi:HlyD family secretion protein
MTTSTEPPAGQPETATLPLLENGKGSGTSVRARSPALFLRLAIALALVLAGAVAGLYFQGPWVRAFFDLTALEPGAGARQPIAAPVDRTPSPERVARIESGDVLALGELRPRGGIVIVGAPFGSGDARVRQLLVSEGDRVKAGDLLAVLDSIIQFEAAEMTAENTANTARAILAQKKVQVAAAEAETRASLESARASLALADAALARVNSLLGRGAASEASRDEAKSRADAARADVTRLEASLMRYRPGPDGVPVDIGVAEADLSSAEAALERARRDLDRARIHAPRDGVIIDVAVREGERLPQSGLLRMGDTGRMEAELEVFQSNIRRVEIGQPVSIVSDVTGDAPLLGHVATIGTIVGRQSVTADDPAANTDARVVRVIVELDEPSSAQTARLAGLEVVARIAVPSSETTGGDDE